MKDRRPDVMTLQDGGPDVYQDVGQEVTSSKMVGGGEPRLKDHFDDHGQIRCFKNSTILLQYEGTCPNDMPFYIYKLHAP